MQDVTIAVLSCVEPPLPECLQAVEVQLGGPYRVIRVHNVAPMSAAFNTMIELSHPSRFLVQVDGDVVLHVGAVETLLHAIRERPRAYMCWGQLFEDGFGVGGSVRIWRRWPLRFFRFKDVRCVDRNLHARIRWTRLYRHQVRWSDAPEQPFGIHLPRQTEFARYSKLKNDLMKWRKLGRWDLIWKAMAQAFRDYGMTNDFAIKVIASGMLGSNRRSKDALQDKREFDRVKESTPHA